MFGHTAFCETAYSDVEDTKGVSVIIPIMYFNSSFLTFPLAINTLANISLNINTLNRYNLNINTINSAELNINKLQNHDLKINKNIYFTTRR